MEDQFVIPKASPIGELDKFRSFSTSTPITSKGTDVSLPPRSLSVSVCSVNDSGYADSIADSVCSFASAEYDTISCNVTPLVHSRTKPFSHFRDNSPELSPSPFRVSSNLHRENSVEVLYPVECVSNSVPQDYQFIPRLNLDDPVDQDSSDSQYGIVGLEDKFNEILKTISPCEPDQVIGRKMGLECVDIISELQKRCMTQVTKVIMDYLDPQDLCRMCLVSKDWMSACNSSRKLYQRRQSYLRQRTPYITGKENSMKKLRGSFDRGLTDSAKRLAPVQSVGRSNQPATSLPCQKDLFAQVAQSLKNDEELKKCPRCQSPSKVSPVQERGMCQNFQCNFDYCVKCFNGFHGSQSCISVSTKRTKSASICGKKSKKNLRRL